MKYLILVAVLGFFMAGCATVPQPVIVPTDVSPVVSKVLEQEKDGRFLKRKVAIARFSNETTYGKGLFSGEDVIGKQAADILSAKLAQTEKFILFESNFVEDQATSFKNLEIPADFLIIGSVAEFGRNATGDTGVFSRTKKQTAFAKIFVRLIDVSSGQIIYGDEGAGESSIETGTTFGGGSSAGYDSSLNDKAIEAAISKLVNNIVENLLHNSWRSYILDIDGENIVISGGKMQGMRTGDVFDVIKKGKTVTNPQTGLEIELPGTKVAVLKVLAFAGETSETEIAICNLVSGQIGDDSTKYYIQEPEDR